MATDENELPQIANFIEVVEPGHYLHTEDVSAWLARFAERYRGEGRVALLDAARAFAPGDPLPDEGIAVEELRTPPVEPPGTGIVLEKPLGLAQALTVPLGREPVEAPAGAPVLPPRVPYYDTDVIASVPMAVARVEVFPNDDGSYWYARGVDATGRVIGDPVGHVNHDGVLGDAERLWPGVAVHEVPDALADSIHAESNPASTWNSRQRPSTRRMFGQ